MKDQLSVPLEGAKSCLQDAEQLFGPLYVVAFCGCLLDEQMLAGNVSLALANVSVGLG
jgi:hypothetical protein